MTLILFMPISMQVDGAWHLRTNALLVLFSSISNWMLSSTVGCYVAANTTLDATAMLMRFTALSGLAVQWGAWSDAGMAKDDAVRGAMDAQLESRGLAKLCTPCRLRTPA